jgi:hypothetical protein
MSTNIGFMRTLEVCVLLAPIDTGRWKFCYEAHSFQFMCKFKIFYYETRVCLQSLYETFFLNCRTLVRQRTIQTERPPLLGEISANFNG